MRTHRAAQFGAAECELSTFWSTLLVCKRQLSLEFVQKVLLEFVLGTLQQEGGEGGKRSQHIAYFSPRTRWVDGDATRMKGRRSRFVMVPIANVYGSESAL